MKNIGVPTPVASSRVGTPFGGGAENSRRRRHETRLLYSSRSQDDVIYRDELEPLSGNGLTVVHALTDPQPPGWKSSSVSLTR